MINRQVGGDTKNVNYMKEHTHTSKMGGGKNICIDGRGDGGDEKLSS